MAKKKKEICPYCGRSFVYLNRHICKLKPKNKESVVEIEKVNLFKGKEQHHQILKEKMHIKPTEIQPKEDIIVESHSNTIKFITKFFRPETIKIGKEKDKNIIRDILKLSIDAFKFLDKKEVNFIKVIFMVNNIGELLQYQGKNLYNYIPSSQLKNFEEQNIDIHDLESRIQKAITISSILNQLREKSLKLDKRIQKVIVAGLDKAGKTAILTTFGDKLGIEDIAKLKPTKKVDRHKIETKDLSLYIWDFGGQTKYRHDYLRNPGTYFIDVNLLLYVIDCQDYARFEESFTYFKEILDALIMLEEKPYILIFVHKFDPDLRNDANILLNIEFIKENLKEILLDKKFDYEIYLTSIYTVLSREPKFAKFLKKMVNEKDLIADATINKIEELGKIINNALNAIINLSESVSRQFNEIDERFLRIENYLTNNPFKSQITHESININSLSPQNLSLSSNITPPSTLHPPPPPLNPSNTSPKSPEEALNGQKSVKGTIIDELKELFAKFKQKKY
ncbi:MAG: ADP-ribosylation factor-like protein [Promethearchaeota archaeon]